jgi:branched-chain amino acid transport system permease protein
MIDSGTIVSGLLAGGLYAIVGLGLSLAFGVMKMVNLAHGELIVLGAYLSTLVVGITGLDPLLSLLIVAPIVFVIALPVQRFLLTPLLSRGQEPPLVATFGMSLLISAALVLGFGGDSRSLQSAYGAVGVEILGVTVRATGIITLAIAVVLIVAAHVGISKTLWGAAVRAAAEDPRTTATMGVNVDWLYAITFGFSAVFAATAGVLVGIGYSFTPTTGAGYLLIGFTVVILGGAGNVLGTLWGGLAVGLIQSVGSAVLGGAYRDFVIYAAFIVILIASPLLVSARSRLSARHAIRMGEVPA